ncbi:MAG: hypothetical protein ACOZF0_01825 [Thermodesulfobacteriota bacterium]
MISKITYINIGLAVLSVFFIHKTVQVWRHDPLPIRQPERPSENRALERETPSVPAGGFPGERPQPQSAFQDVVGKNLFSPEREEYQAPEPGIEALPEEDKPRIEGRDILLFGVVILDGYEAALINNPEAKSAADHSLWVRRGDRVGQLRVEQIFADGVVFTDEGRKKFRVGLYEQSKIRQPAAARQPAKPVVVATPPEKKPKPEPKKDAGIASRRKKDSGTDEQYETISTPFGMMKRKKQ